jgi:Trypsin-like peptidase domain
MLPRKPQRVKSEPSGFRMSSVPPHSWADLDPAFVAELLVTTVDGKSVRGSGYRLTADCVLTASHVISGAKSISLRFNAAQPGEASVAGRVPSAAPGGDVAIVLIDSPGNLPQIKPPRIGRIGNSAAVLNGAAIGFPRFKLKSREPTGATGSSSSAGTVVYRDRVQAVGRIPVLSNSKDGTLEFITDPPAADQDRQHSPWEGMSGAAVWADGCIVGVVSKHHPAESPARLAVARLDRWLSEMAPAERATVEAMLGLAGAVPLADVTPPPPEAALAIGYIDQVRDLAPDILLDRDDELEDLVRFCAGDESYAWWQAGPWAGKSALAAWLVLHPPAGVRVVSFFVTSRWAGQADSDAFTTELIQQLAVLAGEPDPLAATPAAREKARRYLLSAAVDRCAADGQRLLLVVDGLDEDQAATPAGARLPSIASLLPLRPPDVLRILVTSRPHPGLPPDIPPGHPLASCIPRQLMPSPRALQIADLARNELLQRRLSADRRVVDFLAFLTASGGGLTRPEISYLTGLPDWMLLDLFSSVFGRTLNSRSTRDSHRVYLFAHETLREQAILLFQADIQDYQQKIYRWADSYSDRGWPTDTPRYLLASYGRMLAGANEVTRLAALAADPARNDCMLARDHNDAAAFAEILSARRALMSAERPDVTALGKLAVSEWRLQARNSDIPVCLPAVWGRLGQVSRAEQTARTITDLRKRAAAFAHLSAALTDTEASRAGRLAEDAEQTARRITDDLYEQSAALADIASALAEANPDLAEQVARGIAIPMYQVPALAAAAQAITTADSSRARRLAATAEKSARDIDESYVAIPAMIAVARSFARIDPDHAERIAQAISDPGYRAKALAAISAAIASTGPDRADRIAASAEATARAVTSSGLRAEALAHTAGALAITHPDSAQHLAHDAEESSASISDPNGKSLALARIAFALADREPDRAEQIAHSIPAGWRSDTLEMVAVAFARSDLDRAERFAHSIVEPVPRAHALAAIAVVATDPDRAAKLADDAEHAARSSIDPYLLGDALAAVTAALAKRSPERAVRAACAITVPEARARSLAIAAASLASTNPDLADLLSADAERATHDAVINKTEVMADVAATLARTDADRAQRLAAEIEQEISTYPNRKDDALAALAHALAATRPGHAQQIALRISNAYTRDQALAAVAVAVAAADPHLAEQIAHSITTDGSRARALAAVAASFSKTNAQRVNQIAAASENDARESGPGLRAEILADLVRALVPTDSARARHLANEAVSAARECTHPHWRAHALTIAATAIAAFDPAEASKVLAEAMSADGVFTALAMLNPHWTDEAISICDHTALCTGIHL